MAKQMNRCVGCKVEREKCVQRRDGTWRCPACIQSEWETIKRRLVYRSELAAIARARLRKPFSLKRARP
jgi:hypothetical protein